MKALKLQTKEKLVDKRELADKHELGFFFLFFFNFLFPFPIKVFSHENLNRVVIFNPYEIRTVLFNTKICQIFCLVSKFYISKIFSDKVTI